MGRRGDRRDASRLRGRGALAALLAAAFLSAGCVERALLVRSDPAGAHLWVNGVYRGTTPTTIRYVHEGRFTLRFEKEGHESVATEVTTCTRLDAVPGPDFVAENLWPSRIRRHTPVLVRMPALGAEVSRADVEALAEKARAFRAKAKAAASEPGTPVPTPPGRRSRMPVEPFPGPPPAVR